MRIVGHAHDLGNDARREPARGCTSASARRPTSPSSAWTPRRAAPPSKSWTCAAGGAAWLEQLCRTITRPALSDERVQLNATGQVELKLKTPWRDGTTHLVMSPLEFIQRLAALVPRPRLHLIRFHGVLAPNAKPTAARWASARIAASAASDGTRANSR
ncbi:transposase [Ideonella sp. A 288]|uniref:transposase n=1 Tax=Ideonella sp. A 288 TaxID=1962181 RepID=UPI000B4B0741